MILRSLLPALIIYPAYGIFRIMPLPLASWCGGVIARTLGYPSPLTQRARKNLTLAMPELSKDEKERILKKMWWNLGRVCGEFPHLSSLSHPKKFARYICVEGIEHVTTQPENIPYITFSGHLANWEVGPLTAAVCAKPLCVIYRHLNNPYLEILLRYARRNLHDGLLPKGKAGARGALKQLHQGKPIGMLVDQKMNEGIAVPFFGIDAMTAPALSELARKFNAPIIPACVERICGCHFRTVIYPPIHINNRNNLEVMTEVNALLEQWVRKNPEQWFWLHRRWGK